MKMPVHVISGGYANSYLIEGSGGLAVVDVGTGLAAELIDRLIAEKWKGDRSLLKLVTATHFHIDHIGGISELKAIFPAAEVRFSRLVHPYYAENKGLAIPPFTRWITGLIPVVTGIDHPFRNLWQGILSGKAGIPLPFFRHYGNRGFDAECTLTESGEIPFLPEWRIIETPGHTPDSIVFYHESSGALLSGDTVLNMKGTGELNRFCCSQREIRASFRKIARLPVSSLFPGHGKTVENRDALMNDVNLF